MPTQRRMRFVQGQVAWMLAIVLVLVSVQVLTYELVFILSLIGLLILTEVTAPFNVTPAWRRRLRWIIALAVVLFVAIVARRIAEIIQPVVPL